MERVAILLGRESTRCSFGYIVLASKKVLEEAVTVAPLQCPLHLPNKRLVEISTGPYYPYSGCDATSAHTPHAVVRENEMLVCRQGGSRRRKNRPPFTIRGCEEVSGECFR